MARKTTNVLGFILSFLIPGFLFLFILRTCGIIPFGNYTLVSYDLQGQYISFLSYLRSVLLTNNDLIYTFSKPLGGDMISIFTYYLFSPFNIFYLFVNASSLPLMITVVTTLKIATCGLTMYVLLNYLYKNKILTNLTLSLSYAFSSYMIVFHFNIMWIDAVIMLPLIILGLTRIFENKKPYLYSILLAVSILSNYYTGFMTCIFIVMFFLFKLYSVKRSKEDIKNLYKNFILGSVLAGALSSFSWLNAVIAFAGTKTSLGNSNLTDFSFITSLPALMNNLSGNSYVGIEDIINGAPLIFVGCLALYLVILYFANSEIHYKEKLLSGAIIAIFIISFSIRAIDNLWHGGAAPTWFTYRYAFIFDFFIIYLASRVLNKIKSIHIKDYLFVLGFATIQLIVALTNKNKSMLYIEYAMAIIMLGCVICLSKFKNNVIKLSCLTVIFIVNGVDLVKSGKENLMLNVTNNAYMKNDAYQSDIDYISPIIDYIKEYDESGYFYRLEKTFYRSTTYNLANNDSFLFDYAGVSHYSSSDKLNVRNYLGDRLGFHNNGIWNSYGLGSTLGINSLMNIKYIVDEDYFYNSVLIPTRYFGARDYLEHLEDFPTNTTSTAHVFKNNRALGIGFMRKNVDYSTGRQGEVVETSEGQSVTHWYNTYEYINELFKDLSSEYSEDIYKPIPYSINLNNITSPDDNHYYLTSTSSPGEIRYNLSITDEIRQYPCYYSIYPRLQNYLNLYDNSGRNLYYFNYYNHGINPIEQKNRDFLTYRLTLKENLIWNNVFFKNDFFYEDINVLDRYISDLKQNALEAVKISSSHLKGEVKYSKEKTMLMLSIPYDSHWQIRINNKKVKTKIVQDIFIGADLSKLNFEDGQVLQVDIKYVDGKYAGTILLSAVAAAYIVLIGYLNLNKKIKNLKENKK